MFDHFVNTRCYGVENYQITTQQAFTCSKLTIETLEQGMKYVQSWQ